MAVLRLESITKRFGDTYAVNDMSLQVADGDLVCLLGPSGCGKTTTLRIIAGLETADAGDIYIGDRCVTGLSPKDRDVAMVFQFYAMYPDMKAFDQLAYPLKVRKERREEIRRRVKDVADILDISRILDAPVSRLTMEQKQKIELGRAIVREPEVYLFDEPLTNLDTKVRARMRAELKKLQETLKTTTIYVTHDQLEAMAIADKIAVMGQGRIQQFDSPSGLYNSPSNLFVAGFIGSPSMNFLEGTVIGKGESAFLDCSGFLYDVSDFKDAIKKLSPSGELTMGVRPEDVSIIKGGGDKSAIDTIVELVEPLGHRMIVSLRVGTQIVKANVSRSPLQAGDKVQVEFARKKVRLFDRKTELAIA